MKKSIYQIHTEVLDRKSFGKTEWDMFNECVELFQEKRFYSSCTLGMVLFEKLFFSRLLDLSYLPEDFSPTLDNEIEQLKYYMEREREIINGTKRYKRGMSFYQVTDDLNKRNIITREQQDEYDYFYRNYRVPVQHGLTLRLYEEVTNRTVVSVNEVDMLSEKVYEKVSELVIRKIYEITNVMGIED